MFRRTGFAILLVLASAAAAFAALPPTLVNYEGVLRDASDNPLNGNYDMTFRFWDAQVAGNEIFVDAHTAGGGSAVVVTGGLFNVSLGGGTLSDGTGPGVYTSLAEVFRDYSTVWMSIQVGGEKLDPRVRIVAAAYALNATNFAGREASEFLDTSAGSQTKAGHLTINNGIHSNGAEGIHATGSTVGGYFQDAEDSGYAQVGYGNYGIRAFGNGAGGVFEDPGASGYAYCGYGDYGVYALGNTAGAYFKDRDGTSYAYAGYGDYGVYGYGPGMGGYFGSSAGVGYAYLAYADRGIQVYGGLSAGYFENSRGSIATCANDPWGLYAEGPTGGGEFFDLNDTSTYAYAAFGTMGVQAEGATAGGYFADADESGYAYVGYGNRGMWGRGTFAGGTFSHPDTTTFWADVATPTYKIHGTGTVSFVQNHPYERDKVIVYAAPEGDEVAVYTRGSARLENGVARVALGPTFALVANPDLGLTAHLTPRGEAVLLYVESVSTSELVVRGPQGSGIAFDYIVYGLRIGFEDLAVVQPKEREAMLPEPAAIAATYGGRDDLRAYSAGARFRAMTPNAVPTDRADALRVAIDGDRAAVVAAAAAQAERREPLDRPARVTGAAPATPLAPVPTAPTSSPATQPNAPAAKAAAVTATELPAVPAVMLPVSEAVQPGDVLVSDPLQPGSFRRGAVASDPRVVGIVVGPVTDGAAPVATYGVVTCRVDASFGRISAGDLLVVSPTPGHAMRAITTDAGSILGKALEPLEAGLGEIKVLVRP